MQETSAHDQAQADILARAYLDSLAQAEGIKMKRSMLRGNHVHNNLVDTVLDDLDADEGKSSPQMRADVAMAAVLIAREIAQHKGLARLLRKECPVVVINTRTSDMVEQISDVVTACILPAAPNRRHVVARDGSEKSHMPSRGNSEVIEARSRSWPIVGIAPSPKKQLPSSLMRMMQYELSIPPIDRWSLSLVLEAITGTAYGGEIDDQLLRNIDYTDLSLAIHRDLTPELCLERLAEMVGKKTNVDIDGPALEQLAGYGEAKDWGLELIHDITEYRAGRLAWSDVDHSGLLLSGPPGVGKTQFAKALAKSANVPLIATSVADWNAASYLSGTLQAIRDVFGQAKRAAPAVLFIDEIDGISNRSTISGEYVEYWSQIVNLLLECLAGVEDREGVVVVAATNHPDRIDPAIVRAGRLDHHIELEKPDLASLAKIFRFHLGEAVLADVDLMPIAMASRGATGADVEAWVRRGRAAARRARRDIEVDDLLAQIWNGRHALLEDHLGRVALHEAGHVLASLLLGAGDVVGVSLHANGGEAELQAEIRGTMTASEVERHIVVALAGRAAEILVLGSASIGAGNGTSSDLARATELARKLEIQYGLGVFGPAFVLGQPADRLYSGGALLSAIGKRLEAAEQRAATILKENQGVLLRLADELCARRYLSGDEVNDIVDGFTSTATVATNEAAE
ncbi:AAA family ATPase [Devosia sp.]|uniref:AAA family ATPase n=1 Tax=Devosia sp. TaxID=1871048 RepID=UPI0025D101E3|nr:AAA family ATPase [Devosia sp.]MCR6634734.1 AAA family ATPase [Devosia sp.]